MNLFLLIPVVFFSSSAMPKLVEKVKKKGGRKREKGTQRNRRARGEISFCENTINLSDNDKILLTLLIHSLHGLPGTEAAR